MTKKMYRSTRNVRKEMLGTLTANGGSGDISSLRTLMMRCRRRNNEKSSVEQISSTNSTLRRS